MAKKSAGAEQLSAARLRFGQRLMHLRSVRGWNQSDLSRRASEHLQEGQISRDSISKYEMGKNSPNPAFRMALAKALGVEEYELDPDRVNDPRGLEIKQLAASPGKMQFKIDRILPLKAVVEIMAIIEKVNAGDYD